jgi:hypothetical protein
VTLLSGIDDDDEFTQLTDVNTPRADMVGAPAHGWPGWLVMKQDAEGALLDPEFVRDLLSKNTDEEAPVPQAAEAGETVLPNGITLKGSWADVAAFIHAASIRKADGSESEPGAGEVAKAKNDTADREKKAASGAAMPDGSYPIADRADLGKAIHAVGRGGASHDAIRKHIISRARSLGASSEIPDNWNSDGSLKGDVAKEAAVPAAVTKDMMDAAGDAMPLDDGMDGMDPTVPLAMPGDEMEVPGDPTDPGSPAWEAIDAATAAKWLSIAARLKNALGILAEREMLEAASADPSDAENAFDLEDAACAVDYVISTLAVFAAGEMAEAELGAEMAEMCKALAAFDPAPLGVIEGLTAIAKSGRVLSSVNESRIRDAYGALGDVLASLPAAPAAPDQPVAKETEGAMPNHTIDLRGRQLAQGSAADTLARPGPVAKTAMSPEDQARNTGPVNAGGTTGMGQPRTTGPDSALPGDGPQDMRPGDAPGRQVVKASLQVAVYGQPPGRLLGLARPEAIVQQVAKADGDGDGDGKVPMQAVFDEKGNLVGIVDPSDITPVSGAGGSSSDDGDGMQAGPAAAAAPADDMTPQPPAEAGTPADAVGKAADENVITAQTADLDSIIAKAVAAALGAAAPAEDVAKQADVAGALAEVELLKARLAKVEETPAAPKVFTNGAVPPAEQLRGQDRGRNSGQIDVAKALERRHELYTAPDAGTQNQIAKSMQGDAIAALTAIYAAGPSPVRVQPAPVPAAAP